MALTVTQVGRTNVSGNRLTVSLSATTDDTTWPAAGEDFDATQYVANPAMVHIENTGGYVFHYDRATNKLQAYVGQDPADSGGAVVVLQPAVNLNLTGLTMRIMITGGRA